MIDQQGYGKIAESAVGAFKDHSQEAASVKRAKRAAQEKREEKILETLRDAKRDDQQFQLDSKKADRDFQYDMTSLNQTFTLENKKADQNFMLNMSKVSSDERKEMAWIGADKEKNQQNFTVANAAIASNERIQFNNAKQATNQEMMKMFGTLGTAGSNMYVAKKQAKM